jgi:hypothetical protein
MKCPVEKLKPKNAVHQPVNKLICHFLIGFYSLGTLLLPLGDFSFLSEIPQMYRSCQSTEHADMNAFDFITDHLVNIDGLFDKHQNGDDQRPHKSHPVQHRSVSFVSFSTCLTFSIAKPYITEIKKSASGVSFIRDGYLSEVFKPPSLISSAYGLPSM